MAPRIQWGRKIYILFANLYPAQSLFCTQWCVLVTFEAQFVKPAKIFHIFEELIEDFDLFYLISLQFQILIVTMLNCISCNSEVLYWNKRSPILFHHFFKVIFGYKTFLSQKSGGRHPFFGQNLRHFSNHGLNLTFNFGNFAILIDLMGSKTSCNSWPGWFTHR